MASTLGLEGPRSRSRFLLTHLCMDRYLALMGNRSTAAWIRREARSGEWCLQKRQPRGGIRENAGLMEDLFSTLT
jgi:hypothetical protein